MLNFITILVTLIAYACPVQAIVIAFKLDERTGINRQKRADQHCRKVHEHLVQQPRDLEHVQADEIRIKAQGKVLWLTMAIMVRTRLWLGGVISTRRDEQLIVRLKSQGDSQLNTAFIERLNATFRSRLAVLARRTRALLRDPTH